MQHSEKAQINSFISIVAIILIVPILFYETTMGIVNIWIVNETFAHGFLIFPISVWLIWQKRTLLSNLTPSPELLLIALLLSFLIMWLVGNVVEAQVVQQLAMIALIPALVWVLMGRKILVLVLFPLLFLFFAVPIGQALIPSLMEFTAYFIVSLVELVGIPIYQDGLFFALPSGSWIVAEECSGVRYLIASLALGTIYANISYKSNIKRGLFIAVAIVVPIFANGLRAFGIVMIGHFSGMKLAIGADHLTYGWVFFGIVMILMFYIGSYWWDPVVSSDTHLAGQAENFQQSDKITLPVLALISFVLILLIKSYAYHAIYNQQDFPENFELLLPDQLEGWQYQQDSLLDWEPELSAPDAKISKAYSNGNYIVQINIGFYRHQRLGAEAVTSGNRLTNPYGGPWKITYSANIKEQNFYVSETELQKSYNKILIWQWFRIGAFESPNPYVAKVLEAYNRIITNRSDATYISIATVLDENKEISRLRLREFWKLTANEVYSKLESLRK